MKEAIMDEGIGAKVNEGEIRIIRNLSEITEGMKIRYYQETGCVEEFIATDIENYGRSISLVPSLDGGLRKVKCYSINKDGTLREAGSATAKMIPLSEEKVFQGLIYYVMP